jgi:hypothetical protein
VTVAYATADGTAQAGLDYMPTTGTLSWEDGDTAPKMIMVPLLDAGGAAKSLTATLSNPQYGALGPTVTATIALNDAGGGAAGCGCRAGTAPRSSFPGLAAGLVLVAFMVRRNRRRRRRST